MHLRDRLYRHYRHGFDHIVAEIFLSVQMKMVGHRSVMWSMVPFKIMPKVGRLEKDLSTTICPPPKKKEKRK